MLKEVQTYEFRHPVIGHGKDLTHVCVAACDDVEACIGLKELEKLFGGSAIYAAPDGQDFVGVWGKRNTSRFRRFIREAGAVVVMHRSSGLEFRLRVASYQKSRRTRFKVLGLDPEQC